MRAHFWPDVPIMTDHEPFAKTFFQKKWMYPLLVAILCFPGIGGTPPLSPTGANLFLHRIERHLQPGPSSPSTGSIFTLRAE
jgi:hypothetical protein